MSETLLIIDDFEPVRKTVKRIAEREKFLTLQASDGREGLDLFGKEHPSIVITDLKMPLIDGKGVLCAIKQQAPETEVIVLTGYGDSDTAASLIRLGAFSYLQKPLDLHQLVKVLGQARESVRARHPPAAAVAAPASAPPSAPASLSIEVSTQGRLSLRWPENTPGGSQETLRRLGEEFPFPFLVVTSQMDLLYSNEILRSLASTSSRKLDAALLDALRRHGLFLPPFEELRQNLQALLTTQDPVFQTHHGNAYQHLGFFKASVQFGKMASQDVAVLLFPSLGVTSSHRV